MEPGEEGYCQVVEALGDSFIKEDGSIDRPALARIIFQDKKARETVDQITHPLVWERVEQMLEAIQTDCADPPDDRQAEGLKAYQKDLRDGGRAEEETVPMVVVESALFDKTALDFLDEIWYVHAPDKVRIRRLLESRGYSLERCRSMLESQPKDEVFCGMASYIIDNGGTWEDAVRQLAWVSGPAGHLSRS